MKNLLKISCVLAIALFVSMSVKAADPVPQSGSITVNCPAFIDFQLTNPTVALIYDEFGSTDQMFGSTTVEIKSNILWNFKVASLQKAFTSAVGSHSFDVNKITVSGDFFSGNLKTDAAALTLDGQLRKTGLVTFTLATLENQFAGDYSCALTYTLVSR